VALQHEYETFVLIADLQALTDHADAPALIRRSVIEARRRHNHQELSRHSVRSLAQDA
jgi:tryptophanyl-tRNA synthetase